MDKYFDTLYEVGNNTYSYFNVEDVPYKFLVTQNKTLLDVSRKLLWFNLKKKEKSVLLTQKMLPLNSMVLYLLMNASFLNVLTYELDVDSNKIDIYGEWDDFDVENLKKGFIDSVIKPVGISNYDFPYTLKSHVARGFDKDGYKFFCMEHNGKLHRSYWFVRANKYGNLHIVEITETGFKEDALVTAVYHHFLDRKLIDLIVDDFKNGKLTQSTSEDEKIDLEEIKEAIEGDK